MDAQFWLDAWNSNKTGFHQDEYNKKLMQYFPEFQPISGQKVLVPLCGKSKDMIWLHNMNLYVHGVELCDHAVDAFFKENNLEDPVINQDTEFKHYTHQNIVISSGDFFKLGKGDQYDYVYDRASLVALPQPMRDEYAQVITDVLKTGGKYLLLIFEYDQSKKEGPPFSIDANEVHRLYEENFTIELKESEQIINNGPKIDAMTSSKRKVYVLTKK